MIVSCNNNINLPLADMTKIVDMPLVIKVNKFDEDSAKIFNDEFNKAHSGSQPVIPIVIDSYGGQAYSLSYMIDICRSSKKPIATIILGKAMSCGAILATCGWNGYRFASPKAVILIHDVSSASFGKTEEIKSDANETSRLNDDVYKIMAENCGKPDRYFWDIVQSKGRADWYLTAEEAKYHNIVNEIRIPKLNVKLEASYSFE